MITRKVFNPTKPLRTGTLRAPGSAMSLRMIYRGRPKVRVIEPNGRHRHFSAPITLPELHHLYPHHCVRDVSGSILSADTDLKGGNTYLLLPLPKLFPCASSSSSDRHPCSCFLNKEEEDDTAIVHCSSIWKPRGLSRARRGSNPQRFSRISAQEWENEHNGSNKTLRHERSWQPSLDIISENNELLRTKDEQPVEKMEEKTAKPYSYTFNHSSLNGERDSNLQVIMPSGFIF